MTSQTQADSTNKYSCQHTKCSDSDRTGTPEWNRQEIQILINRLQDSNLLTEKRFIVLEEGSKAPQGPHDQARCDGREARTKLAEGRNIGVYAGNGLFIIDIDDREIAQPLIESLPDTLVVTTPHGGWHFYHHVSQTLPEDIENVFGAKNPTGAFGETRIRNTYCVSPGCHLEACAKSWHDCSTSGEGRYTVANDVPIADLSTDSVIDALCRDPDITQQDTSETDISRHQSLLAKNPSCPKYRRQQVRYGRNTHSTFRNLWEWASGEREVSKLPERLRQRWELDKRSGLEVTLSTHIMFWAGDVEATQAILDELRPPKWSHSEDGTDQYRGNLLWNAKQQTLAQDEYYQPDAQEGSGVRRRWAHEVIETAVSEFDDAFRTVELEEAIEERYANREGMADWDVVGVGREQLRKVLSNLKDEDYLTIEQRGQCRYWVKVKDDDAIMQDRDDLLQEYRGEKEINAIRRLHFGYDADVEAAREEDKDDWLLTDSDS
jgi:hypothetical protein